MPKFHILYASQEVELGRIGSWDRQENLLSAAMYSFLARKNRTESQGTLHACMVASLTLPLAARL